MKSEVKCKMSRLGLKSGPALAALPDRRRRPCKQKQLGIYIDEHLTWSSHIDHLCSILASKISLLRQLSRYVSIEYQQMFYQGYILPFI